ncbi:MAG: hypothetical protein Q7U86_02135, partial [Draconibacterium sp.]|nr:hypothetical protein [Draconibacterium sp.]
MKIKSLYKSIWLIIPGLLLIYLVTLIYAKQEEQNKFSFYKENNLYISSIEGEISFLGSDIKVKKEKIIK